MNAIIYTKYGSPDVLELKEVEKVLPKDDDVLVKICAAGVNPLDWHKMRADPFPVRLGGGFLKPKDPRLGADMAGRVEAVGRNVTSLRPGDEVFGVIGVGSFAEYVCVPAKLLVPKPTNLSFVESAAVPVAALTALQGLRDTGKIQQGQQVLINGASGGVGTFAVQMAKQFGGEVTGVCSTRNIDLVRSIGADHVIDYTQHDFTQSGKKYDLIFDAVGNYSVGRLRKGLTPQGIAAVAGFTALTRVLQIAILGSRGAQKISMFIAQPNQKDLLIIKELLESGKVAPVIDRHYPLAQTADAIRYLETSRARGKVVITMAENKEI